MKTARSREALRARHGHLTLLERHHPVVEARVRQCAREELAITVISVEEQLTGWYALLRRTQQPAQLASTYRCLLQTVQRLGALPILSFDEPAIARHAELVKLKLNIGKMDLRIATIALEHAATLVTRNTRDFSRVPDRRLEDWSR